MRSYFPIFLLLGGVLVLSLVGFIFFSQRSKNAEQTQEESVVIRELSIDERPYVTLTPDKNGQELAMSVSKIPSQASTLEYELVYTAKAQSPNTGEVTQGVPGSVSVVGQSTINRKLTLGTCSSGVCRYDKGVRDITFTIRIRDTKGKLMGKVSTGVVMETAPDKLSSSDQNFKAVFDKKTSGVFLVMNTLGLPAKVPGALSSGPYGVFSSSSDKINATVTFSKGNAYELTGTTWNAVSGKVKTPGVFVSTTSQ